MAPDLVAENNNLLLFLMLLWSGGTYLGRFCSCAGAAGCGWAPLFEGLTGLDVQGATSTWLAVEAGCRLGCSWNAGAWHLHVAWASQNVVAAS